MIRKKNVSVLNEDAITSNSATAATDGPHLPRSSSSVSFISCNLLSGALALFLINLLSRSLNIQNLSFGNDTKIVTTASRIKWNDPRPDFCQKISTNPTPRNTLCMMGPYDMTCERQNESMMFSQRNQDYYLYTRHFKYLNRPGLYVDIGANDPVHISNTYFLDRCLQWNGICVEGNLNYIEPLYSKRSCHIAPVCVSSKDGALVEYSIFNGWSGIVDQGYKHKQRFKQDKVVTFKHRCSTMENILRRNGIQHVDYMSLDVEGHEKQVLEGFNWEHVTIDVMTIETTPDTLNQISEFMLGKGYIRHIPTLEEGQNLPGLLGEDIVFIHESVTFGAPT